MLFALSHAWQSWKSAKAVAVLAFVALAAGIGSTTAIYTVVNAVMLRPLPYPESERFVALYGASVEDPAGRSSHTFPTLLAYQQRTRSFDVFGWFRPENFNLTSPGQPQHVAGAAVTPSLAHHLGVNPVLGRWFEDATGAVLSHALWTRLGADPGLVAVTDGRHPRIGVQLSAWAAMLMVGFRFCVAAPTAQCFQRTTTRAGFRGMNAPRWSSHRKEHSGGASGDTRMPRSRPNASPTPFRNT